MAALKDDENQGDPKAGKVATPLRRRPVSSSARAGEPLAQRVSKALSALVVVIGAIAISVSYLNAPQTAKPPDQLALPEEPVSIEGAAVRGSPTAKVVLIEYTDFQCPFCGTFALKTFPEIARRYIDPGHVLFVLRHRPLSIHPYARVAAEAAVCADRQGKTWQMHDLLFQQGKRLSDAVVADLALQLGLQGTRFDNCLGGGASDQVAADIQQADALRMRTTPSFFLGTRQIDGRVRVQRRMIGAMSVEALSGILDAALR